MAGPAFGAVSKQIVLQLAARAIRRVHLDAQMLTLGQLDDEPTALRSLNVGGKGVATAPESAVRDALAQEFNASKLAHGWKIRAGEETSSSKPSARWFGVMDREVTCSILNKEDRTKKFSVGRVDLVYRRVRGPGDETVGEYPIAPLELKRAEALRLNLSSGSADPVRDQVAEVQKDLRKLARMVRASREKRLHIDADLDLPGMKRCERFEEDVYPHVLFWGRTKAAEERARDPVDFLNAAFNDDLARCGCTPKTDGGQRVTKCEFIPVTWPEWPFSEELLVSEWLWLALEELQVEKVNGCTGRTCSCQLVPEA